jgi:hypothetical protein
LRKRGERVTLCVFYLIELDGRDLRQEPLETRKTTLASSAPTPYAPTRKPRPKPKPGRPASRRAPEPTRRCALELLVGCGPEGCSEAVMLANGIDVDTMVEIILEGLATATPQRTRAGREVLEVAVLRIMDAGRRALAEA